MKFSKLLLPLCLLFVGLAAKAQVGIGTNTPAASAQLEVSSTSKGFLPPRMTEAQKNAISAPADGLVIFQTDGTSGLYLRNAGAWKIIDMLSGVPYTGATQAVNLGAYDLKVNGLTVGAGPDQYSVNTIVGESALYHLTSLGYGNTAVGSSALYETKNGVSNTAIGIDALHDNVSGGKNTASGEGALNKNIGNSNTGTGYMALFTNLSGINNTAIGALADVSVNNLTNATAIGYAAKVATSNTIQLGNTSVTAVKTSGTLTSGTVTYPNTHNATAGQVLTTNALGVASWATPAAGGSGTSTHSIGESYGGGLVFYVTPNGLHGLVLDTKEQGIVTWYNAKNEISKSANHSTDGQNYTDWRLPTRNDMELIKTAFGAWTPTNPFTNSQEFYFWTGDEVTGTAGAASSEAWSMALNAMNVTYTYGKDNTRQVISVRSF